MWNNLLGSRLETYQNAVLSVVEEHGYPCSVRCQVRVNVAQQRVVLPNPPAQIAGWRGLACLLFHEHDAQLESLRQLVLLGTLQD
ncbi:MAG: hypothetical protein ACRDHZ_04340, partial [Ktedonobacteraceae bacterium]